MKEEEEEEGEEFRVLYPNCIVCGSVVTPKKKTFLDDPNFSSVWNHLCTQMEVPVATRDSLFDRLMKGEGTFCTKTCLPILIGISKLLHQISVLQEKLEEKTTEIRNRVVAASALDEISEVDEDSLVYSFRHLIATHTKAIKRNMTKSGPCPKSKKSFISQKTNEPPPSPPEEPPQKYGMELRNESLAAEVEVKEEEEWETDTDDSEARPPSTAEDIDSSAPEEETSSTPPHPPKDKPKHATPRKSPGSLKCPKCPFSVSFSSTAEKKTSLRKFRSHYHKEHFYKKLISRKDLQKTLDGKDFFRCPSCSLKVFVKSHAVQTEAHMEHRALQTLQIHFLQSHEEEQEVSKQTQKRHGGFDLAAAEENVDYFRCPFDGCGFVSQVVHPHAPSPKGQGNRMSAILTVARHHLKFHEDLVTSSEKTRRNPAVMRDPETQAEILKCPKCEFKLDYIANNAETRSTYLMNQSRFTKHYASHILPLYKSKPNLYEKGGSDEQ